MTRLDEGARRASARKIVDGNVAFPSQRHIVIPRRFLLVVAGLIVVSLVAAAAVLLRAERQTPRKNFGARSPLPLPSTFLPDRLPEFQKN